MIRYLKNFFHKLIAVSACLYYRFPGKKMTVIAITGTSGKTTTAYLLYHIIRQARLKVSVITSNGMEINGEKLATGLHVTTPSPFRLQKFLRQALDGASKYFILEVTSHALDQSRVFGTSIDMALITNIAHEHLDYHRTIKKYQESKTKIFKGVSKSFINADDPSLSYQLKKAEGEVVTFALKNKADYTLANFPLKTKLMGRYNLRNCLAAAAIAHKLGIKKEPIQAAIASFIGVKGRLEKYVNKGNFDIYIDFAHKPDALNEVLTVCRRLTKNKLIVVFGCAGLRDILKRPMMGRIAAEKADYVILTAEDPRTEDVREINNQIVRGFGQLPICPAVRGENIAKIRTAEKKFYYKIADRQEAINFAIRKLARKGDLVLLCGKSHEKSMCYGKTEYSYDEFKAVEKALYGTI